MTQLQIIADGKTYNLRPGQEYVLGRAPDCQPCILNPSLDEHHLKFFFNNPNGTWYATDLNTVSGSILNNQKMTNNPSPITQQSRFVLGLSVVLMATPESAIQPPMAQPQQQNPVTPTPSYPQVPHGGLAYNQSSLEHIGWSRYVENEVAKQTNWLKKISVRFAMLTGIRNTPWIISSLEGYVLPPVRKNEEDIRTLVHNQVNQVKQYKYTDCYLTDLTDAHVVNSAIPRFLGVELFPIVREEKADFRRFCVVSYHRIKTYLIIEKYGNDTFVNWITRFEPEPTVMVPLVWLIITSLMSLASLTTSAGIINGLSPTVTWCIIYLLTPFLMKKLHILPKKANAYLIITLCISLYSLTVLFLSLISLTSGSRSFR
jgi:hypothetical protein